MTTTTSPCSCGRDCGSGDGGDGGGGASGGDEQQRQQQRPPYPLRSPRIRVANGSGRPQINGVGRVQQL